MFLCQKRQENDNQWATLATRKSYVLVFQRKQRKHGYRYIPESQNCQITQAEREVKRFAVQSPAQSRVSSEIRPG